MDTRYCPKCGSTLDYLGDKYGYTCPHLGCDFTCTAIEALYLKQKPIETGGYIGTDPVPEAKEHTDYNLRDSGEREIADTGMVRDVRTGKGRFDLISPHALKRLAIVYEKGAIKYSARNWEKGMPIGRFLDSALRHISSYLEGDHVEDNLAQAAWNLFCVMHFESTGRTDLQDIPTRPDYKKEDK